MFRTPSPGWAPLVSSAPFAKEHSFLTSASVVSLGTTRCSPGVLSTNLRAARPQLPLFLIVRTMGSPLTEGTPLDRGEPTAQNGALCIERSYCTERIPLHNRDPTGQRTACYRGEPSPRTFFPKTLLAEPGSELLTRGFVSIPESVSPWPHLLPSLSKISAKVSHDPCCLLQARVWAQTLV